MSINEDVRTIGSVERACDILDILEERDSVTVSDLAEAIDLSRGTTYCYLASLVKKGYVVKGGTDYSLSLRYISLSRTIKERIEIFNTVKSELDELADRCGEAAQFAMEERGKAVIVYRATGSDAVNPSLDVGEYEHMHCIAAGKAIMAHLPETRRQVILEEHGLPGRTNQTVVEPNELESELESIRDRGYALDEGERVPGVRCVAVPIVRNGEVVGAISISGPARRMTDDRMESEFVDGLLQSANVIEVNSLLTD